MDAEQARIMRQELINNLTVKQAHMTFAEAVQDFPAEHMNDKPGNLDYSFWHLLEHIRIAQKDLLDYMVAEEYHKRRFPVEYWPDKSARTDAAGWQATIDGFHADLQIMVDLINDPDFDIFASINRGWEGHNMLREILITADHNAYHVGEFAILRHLNDLW